MLRDDSSGVYTQKGGTHTLLLHEDQARDQYSIAEVGLVTEGKERKEENQTIFLPSSNADEAEAITDLKKLRKVNYQIHWRSEQNAEYWIHWSATQERIWADSLYAIIMYQSILKECVVKVVNKSGDENSSQDTYASKGPKVHSEIFWVMITSTFGAILGKPRPKLRMWDFDPIQSQLVDLQGRAVHADTNSHKDNILSEKAAKKSHEAGNCEMHKTNLSNSLQTFTWHSKEYDGEVYTLKDYDGEEGRVVQTLSHNWK